MWVTLLLLGALAVAPLFQVAYAGDRPIAVPITSERLQCLGRGGIWGRVAVYEYNGARSDDKFTCVESSDRCRRSEFPCRSQSQTFLDNRWPVQCCRANQTCHPEQKAQATNAGWAPPKLCWNEPRYIVPYKRYHGAPP
jgi:hypothetical protein